MPFKIIRNDITKVKADAIVNSANPAPVIGGGTERTIYKAAGENALLEERKKIGSIHPGEAKCTNAFALSANYIIHTVSPVWRDGHHGESDTLRACYKNALTLAHDLKCKSIAFPLIATGAYQFPKDRALAIALAEIRSFLSEHVMQVILVVFDEKSFKLSQQLTDDIEAYISEHQVETLTISEKRSILDKCALPSPADVAFDKTLDDFLNEPGETFQERLFELIDESGMDDVTVYKKANIDRRLFSRIKAKKDYRPKKKTAVAFAIALELDMPTMTDLLSRAGLALSPSDKFDLIISYFVINHDYDIYKINAALFQYGEPILG